MKHVAAFIKIGLQMIFTVFLFIFIFAIPVGGLIFIAGIVAGSGGIVAVGFLTTAAGIIGTSVAVMIMQMCLPPVRTGWVANPRWKQRR